jgi:nicotinate-nucleotide adenylyltransferase
MQRHASHRVPEAGRRVGFFGGSFDPPHLGHLAVARAARDALALDTVLFAPVGAQPLKPEGASAGFGDRLAMTRLAVTGERGFAISLVDAPKAAPQAPPQTSSGAEQAGAPSCTPNFTVDSLLELTRELPAETTLFCLLGADSFFGLRRWHRAAELPFLAPLIVASRPGQPMERLQEALPGGLSLEMEQRERKSGIEVASFSLRDEKGRCAPFFLLPGLDVEISATAIRAAVRDGARPELERLLPEAVAGYIREHGLYR